MEILPGHGSVQPENNDCKYAIVSCVSHFQEPLEQLARVLDCSINRELGSSTQLRNFFKKFWLELEESIRFVLVTLVLAAEYDEEQGTHKLVDSDGVEIDLAYVYSWINYESFSPKNCMILLLVQGAVGSDRPPSVLEPLEAEITQRSLSLPLRPLFYNLLVSQVFTDGADPSYLESFMDAAAGKNLSHCADVARETHRRLQGITEVHPSSSHITSSLSADALFRATGKPNPFDEDKPPQQPEESRDAQALLIANENFGEPYDIGGCVQQMNTLKYALESKNVGVQLKSNRTASQMRNDIEEFAKKIQSSHVLCCVVIFTHGYSDCLYGTDIQPVACVELFAPLNNRIPDKPKFILVEACSGDHEHGLVDAEMLQYVAEVFQENAEILRKTRSPSKKEDAHLLHLPEDQRESAAQVLDEMEEAATNMQKNMNTGKLSEPSDAIKTFFTDATKEILQFSVSDVLFGRRNTCVEQASECQRLLPPQLLLKNALLLRSATPGCRATFQPGGESPSKMLQKLIDEVKKAKTDINVHQLLLKLKDLNQHKDQFESGTAYSVETYFEDNLLLRLQQTSTCQLQ